MPAIYKQTFKARYYECDALGYLKNVSLLRWMQESAFAASATVGYDFTRYHHLGQLWLVRESNIEVFAQPNYGDEVELTTYVQDIRRFRSIRAYEVRNTQLDTLMAKGSTDWVYLDTETLRPVTIPRAMQSAFFPEGVPEKSLPRKRFPRFSASTDGISVIRKIVVWDDLDMMWHVNNANYLNYMDEVEKHALDKSGWSVQRLNQIGLRIHTEQQRIEYLQPAVLGDEITVSTWCTDSEGCSALRHYEIHRARDGELLVQAMARWCLRNIETDEVERIPAGLSGV